MFAYGLQDENVENSLTVSQVLQGSKSHFNAKSIEQEELLTNAQPHQQDEVLKDTSPPNSRSLVAENSATSSKAAQQVILPDGSQILEKDRSSFDSQGRESDNSAILTKAPQNDDNTRVLQTGEEEAAVVFKPGNDYHHLMLDLMDNAVIMPFQEHYRNQTIFVMQSRASSHWILYSRLRTFDPGFAPQICCLSCMSSSWFIIINYYSMLIWKS